MPKKSKYLATFDDADKIVDGPAAEGLHRAEVILSLSQSLRQTRDDEKAREREEYADAAADLLADLVVLFAAITGDVGDGDDEGDNATPVEAARRTLQRALDKACVEADHPGILDGLADGSLEGMELSAFVARYALALAYGPVDGRLGVLIIDGKAYPAQQKAQDGNFRKRATRAYINGTWSEWCKDDHDLFTVWGD